MVNSAVTHEARPVRSALAGQTEALRLAVRALGEPELALPTRLGTWRVRELTAHLDRQIGWAPEHLDDPLPAGVGELTLTAWVGVVGTVADALDRGTREHTAAHYAGSAEQAAARFDEVCGVLAAFLASPASADADRPFPLAFGVMRLADFLVTRLVETVVHADDLAHALGLDAFPHDARAVAIVAELLLDAVAPAAAGPAREAAQADPLRWIRLATGRESVTGTGLAEHLPVLS
ncbi:maleylpyruvate isomerase N-terminal domain-containing protein [Kitasatospora sp. NPDC049285]|uniref:maleylpyruvate isomerase N-terminal domain-containing protein n=1 Tax=Kitasatospora sp. NPDC049285 TaxID=3157096 RepID=UPI003443DB82